MVSSGRSFGAIFPNLPRDLLDGLEKTYSEIKKNFVQRRYAPSELEGAKFCEVVFRILEWHTSGGKQYTPLGTHIPDFGKATRKFESLSAFPDSIRFHIPKLLNALYDIRNKRGVGHVGGDVDPNHMDAVFVVSSTDWIMAELVRIFHSITTVEAQDLVEALISKNLPIVWEVAGKKRILNPRMPHRERILVFLYDIHPKPMQENQLREWVEYKNQTRFRDELLRELHDSRLIEYNKSTGEIYISPLGIRTVETEISLEI